MRHPSSLAWFRFSARDLHPWEVVSLHWHGLLCRSCNLRLKEAQAEAREAHAPPLLPGISARPPSSRWLAPALAGAMLVALALVMVQVPDREGLNAKGGSRLDLWVASEPPRLLSGKCFPGERVQPLVETKKKFLLVVGIDPSGGTQVLFPLHGVRSGSVPEGKSALPQSWTFDSVLGTERFIAYFSDSALTPQEALKNADNKEVERIERSCLKALGSGTNP